jgi:hypothetical protein
MWFPREENALPDDVRDYGNRNRKLGLFERSRMIPQEMHNVRLPSYDAGCAEIG